MPRDIDEGPSAEDLDRFSDETRACPECSAEVYDEASVCPRCGHIFEGDPEGASRKPMWAVIGVILALLAFLLVYGLL
jgi:uncharacterized paraquat-inducible protein A